MKNPMTIIALALVAMFAVSVGSASVAYADCSKEHHMKKMDKKDKMGKMHKMDKMKKMDGDKDMRPDYMKDFDNLNDG